MSADAGAGIIVPDTHNPERFRRILRQFAEVNDIGRLLPGHEFNRHIQMPADDLVHRRLRNAIPSLAAALRKELDEVFALSCTYTYSTPGITTVTIR